MSDKTSELVSWFRAEALPYWAQNAFDQQYGGFLEELAQDGGPSKVTFKRIRVQGRQIFSFSMCALLKWDESVKDLACKGFEFLKSKAWNKKDRHWVKQISREGEIIDSTFDLYDNAFVTLGLSALYKLTGDAEILDYINQTVEAARHFLISTLAIGYRQSPQDKCILRQNPNMHWLEAMLFCFEATGLPLFHEEAKNICHLAEKFFIDASTGALREVFDDHWQPVAENGKILVEPGHHYEWSWLLDRARKNKIPISPELIEKLLGFADRFGINEQLNLPYDQIATDGTVTLATHRLWPQTEAIKAWVIRPDKKNSERQEKLTILEKSLLQNYLYRTPKGTWNDRLDSDGTVHKGPIPASSLYHIMLCVAELARMREE